MPKQLAMNVTVGDQTYEAGSTPPPEIAEQITNPRAWAGPDEVPHTKLADEAAQRERKETASEAGAVEEPLAQVVPDPPALLDSTVPADAPDPPAVTQPAPDSPPPAPDSPPPTPPGTGARRGDDKPAAKKAAAKKATTRKRAARKTPGKK